ncbi:epoxyqueuosine reductase QueH [bacterium]|nr:epoxyqueuosine reductase QueH [bacterium]
MSDSSEQKKLLLHVCCAVCASYPVLQLQEMGYEVILYFYNPNIYPIEEYQRRLNELKKLAERYNIRLIIEETGYDYWLNLVKGLENEPEKGNRCRVCFKERLSKAAVKATEENCEYFTTTLTVSPHKNSKQIFEAAKEVCNNIQNPPEFLEIDFKKKDGYKKTSNFADKYGFYRQKHCGCEFSIRK